MKFYFIITALSVFTFSCAQNQIVTESKQLNLSRNLASDSGNKISVEELPADLSDINAKFIKEKNIVAWSMPSSDTDLLGRINTTYKRVWLQYQLQNNYIGSGAVFKSLIIVNGFATFIDGLPSRFTNEPIKFFPLSANMLTTNGPTEVQVIIDTYKVRSSNLTDAQKIMRSSIKFKIEENKKAYLNSSTEDVNVSSTSFSVMSLPAYGGVIQQK